MLDKPEEQAVAMKIKECFFYIGRYCDFTTYLPIIKSGLKGEFYNNQDYIRCSFESLAQLVKGSLEAIPSGEGLGKKRQLVEEVLDIVTEKDILNTISTHNFVQTASLMDGLIRGLLKQGTPEEIKEILTERCSKVVSVLGIVSYI